MNPISFFVISVSGSAFLEYPSMNFLLKLANPKKLCTSLTSCSIGYSAIALIFSRLILIPFVLTINPRNSTDRR